ncbi:hypothetical protein AB2T90_11115 [Clostridium butyricum]|uniref:hypothetical protein n=1 Tax=Clostridium butyricum TaxID=1492 RepID=UPI0034652AEA
MKKYNHKIEISFNSNNNSDGEIIEKNIINLLKDNNINFKALNINCDTSKSGYYNKGQELLENLAIKTRTIKSNKDLRECNNCSAILIDKNNRR